MMGGGKTAISQQTGRTASPPVLRKGANSLSQPPWFLMEGVKFRYKSGASKDDLIARQGCNLTANWMQGLATGSGAHLRASSTYTPNPVHLKAMPESGLDCLICAKFARQRLEKHGCGARNMANIR